MEQALQMTQIFYESVILFIVISTPPRVWKWRKIWEKKIGYEHPHKVNEIDKEKCEGPLAERECFEAVKSMESGKSPGTDGPCWIL